MTPEELLIPRFKCIAPLPFQPEKDMYNVGDIFTDNGKTVVKNQNGDPVYPVVWQEYPHLFKPLQWYEDRRLEEMPVYVKCTATPDQRIMPGRVLKITEWFASGCGRSGEHVVFPYTNCFQPVTREEYESYLKEKEESK